MFRIENGLGRPLLIWVALCSVFGFGFVLGVLGVCSSLHKGKPKTPKVKLKPQEEGSAPQQLTTLLQPYFLTGKEGPYAYAN